MVNIKNETRGKISLVYTKFFILFILFLFVPLASAAVSDSEELSFQHDKTFDLKRACANNGFFCGASTVCNITLIYPDGEILQDNVGMTFTSSYRNLTVPQSLNNQLGWIQAIQSCNNVTDANTDTFKIAITGDGEPPQDFPTQFSIIIFGFLLIGAGLINERMRLFQYAGAMLIMVMGVLTAYPGYSFINWSTLTGKALSSIFIGCGAYFLLEPAFSRNIQTPRYSTLNEEQMEQEELDRIDREREEFFEKERGDDGRNHQ